MGAPLSLKSVPEGGWRAWITVLASFMVHFLQNGFRDSFGLLLPSIRKNFQVGHAEAATTNSIMMFLILSSSPLAACMIKKVGHRLTMGIGVGISALGLLIAGGHIDRCGRHGILPNIVVLYMAVGGMTGLGFGLIYLPSIDILKLYFHRKLGLANGISNAGSGLGQFFLAPIINVVEEEYGLSGLFYVLSAIVGFSIVFCFAFPAHNTPGEGHKYKALPRSEHFSDSSSRTALSLMVLHVFLVSLGHYSVLTFFADRASSFGISRDSCTLLLSIMGLASTVARKA